MTQPASMSQPAAPKEPAPNEPTPKDPAVSEPAVSEPALNHESGRARPSESTQPEVSAPSELLAPEADHSVTSPATAPAAELTRPPAALNPLRIPIPGMVKAALLGAGAHLCGIALTVTAAWLIVAASFRPPILTLLAAIVAVRAFGLARPLLRYLERVASHRSALSFLALERARVYHALIPLTPARLGRRARGDVLAGVVDDLDDIAYAHVRVVVPLGALIAAGAFAALLCAVISFATAALVLSLVITCVAVGILTYRLTLNAQRELVAARARVSQISTTALNHRAALVGIQAVPDVLTQLDQAQRDLAAALRKEGLVRAVSVTGMPLLTVVHTVAIAAVLADAVASGLPTPLAALLLLAPVALGEVVGTVPDAVTALARAHQAQHRLGSLLALQPAVAAAFHHNVAPAEAEAVPTDQATSTPTHRTSLRTIFSRSAAQVASAVHLSQDSHHARTMAPAAATERGGEPVARVTISKPAIHDVLFAGASPEPEIRITASAHALAALAEDAPTADPAATDADRDPAPPAEAPAARPREPQPLVDPSPGVQLELIDVTAGWTPEAEEALPPTSVRIDAGEIVGIVGNNGVGKSTLLAVIARHLDPRTGEYLLNDADALHGDLATVRSHIGIVDDAPHIMSTTVRENLRLAAPTSDDAHLVKALRLAGLHEWFAQLPHGLDTLVGHGHRGLSGGESTRLSVARALASDRPLLLLDEPVAHLDHPTAVSVLADVREAAYGRTVVIVSHRTEGLDHAHRVLELTHRLESETEPEDEQP